MDFNFNGVMRVERLVLKDANRSEETLKRLDKSTLISFMQWSNVRFQKSLGKPQAIQEVLLALANFRDIESDFSRTATHPGINLNNYSTYVKAVLTSENVSQQLFMKYLNLQEITTICYDLRIAFPHATKETLATQLFRELTRLRHNAIINGNLVLLPQGPAQVQGVPSFLSTKNMLKVTAILILGLMLAIAIRNNNPPKTSWF